MAEKLLDMRHVEICYDGKPAVQDLTLSVEPGEILAVVGESGSGKSSILRAAMGLLGTGGAVTDGEILYKGKNVRTAKGEELRRMRGPEMGMVFQNTESSLCPVRTVGDQIYECVAQHERTDRETVRQRALDLLGRIGLSDGERILKSYPFELSGGMNQRVGIAMAMILHPALLFADEPTSALDVTVQAQVVREMMKLREIDGTGIVIVTHNIGVAGHMADRIAVLHRGRLVECGEKEEIMCHPQEEYTRRLLGAVLRVERRCG